MCIGCLLYVRCFVIDTASAFRALNCLYKNYQIPDKIMGYNVLYILAFYYIHSLVILNQVCKSLYNPDDMSEISFLSALLDGISVGRLEREVLLSHNHYHNIRNANISYYGIWYIFYEFCSLWRKCHFPWAHRQPRIAVRSFIIDNFK